MQMITKQLTPSDIELLEVLGKIGGGASSGGQDSEGKFVSFTQDNALGQKETFRLYSYNESQAFPKLLTFDTTNPVNYPCFVEGFTCSDFGDAKVSL